jgi:tryptophan-rich sensory protein
MMRIFIFLLLNFVALGLGGLFTSGGVQSEWYQNLNKAPWTPPGWVFGFAWTSIMICFALYMSQLLKLHPANSGILLLYALQWLLNVAWNPLFFRYHATFLALLCIVALTLLVAFFAFRYLTSLQWHSLLVAPYLVWLCIAVSLNAYICFKNA